MRVPLMQGLPIITSGRISMASGRRIATPCNHFTILQNRPIVTHNIAAAPVMRAFLLIKENM
jgi:hypothetical protein